MIRAHEDVVTSRPAAALLRGGVTFGAIGAAVVTVGAALDSPRAGGSALVGAVLAMAALSVGPLLMAAVRTASPPAVMGIALTGYAITVLALAVAYVLLGTVAWLSDDHVGFGILGACAAWLVGQLRAAARLRVLVFGSGTQGDPGPEEAGHNGSPASPSEASH